MKNKGSVVVGISVLVVFLGIIYGLVTMLKQKAKEIQVEDKTRIEERATQRTKGIHK